MASTGIEKWNKYFSNGCQTILKHDTQLLDKQGKDIGIALKRGDSIVVCGGDYSTKPIVIVGGVEGRVKLSDLEKPIHISKTLKFDLKPDKIGIAGQVKMTEYPNYLRCLIENHQEIPKAVKKYLGFAIMHLLDSSPKSFFWLEKSFLEIKDDRQLINTINRDFLEAVGPLISLQHDSKFKSYEVFFPTAGNEPLYDFKLIKNGEEELFSSKKGSGSTNTLKAALLYDRCQGVSGFERELELFRIIKQHKVRETPNLINEWLSRTFSSYQTAKPATNNEEIVKLEANVVKYINNSDLNFIPLIKTAIPDVWYVKAQLTDAGAIRAKPLIKAGNITKVSLRSKSSPNHMCDKLGFQI